MPERKILSTLIRHIPLEPAFCIESGTSAGAVIEQMKTKHSSCVLICREERCVGIFTERDYVNKVLARDVNWDSPVDEFMSKEPKTLSLDATIGSAVSLMNEFGFRNIPLVDREGKCVGLLQIRNIIHFLSELYPEEVLNVSSRPESFRQTHGA